MQERLKFGLVAPAGFILDADWKLCLEFVQKKELDFYYSPLVNKKHFFFAGNLEQKKKQFLETLQQTKLLFAIRGGSGSMHLLDFFSQYWSKKNAFAIIGFSDISILLNFLAMHFQQVGIHSFVVNSLRKASKKDQDFFFHRIQGNWQGELAGDDAKELVFVGKKKAETKLLGGNLSSLVSLIGTPYQISFAQAILFLEDVAVPYYHIERLFAQLYYAGSLQKIAGLVLGHFLWKNQKLDSKKIINIVQDFLPDIPIVYNFPAGHGKKNAPLPIGAEVVLDTAQKKFFAKKEKIILI